MNIIDKFIILLREREDDGTPPPILHYDGVSFSFIKVMDLYGILKELFISQLRHGMEMVFAPLALVRGIHQPPLDFSDKGLIMQSLVISFVVNLSKLLNNQ